MIVEVSKVGKRDTVVIPAGLRRRFNVTEGSLIMTEETPDGILLRPAAVMPVRPSGEMLFLPVTFSLEFEH